MARIVRVFPRRTSHTPADELAFVGDPPLWTPPSVDEVHVSCTFTWDLEEARRLAGSWQAAYPDATVRLGGPATGDVGEGFTPGQFLAVGYTFTSRGCDNQCPWCLVPEREGRLRLLVPRPGHVILDNNFLQTPATHRHLVCRMLARQRRAAVFAGGLQPSLVTDDVADELRGLRIDSVFLAADTEGALRPLARAVERLAFLGRERLRCYTMIGYGGETIPQAEARLETVWELGAMPFAQLYQPPTARKSAYSADWRRLQKTWSRPAAMKAMHRGAV